LGGIAKSKEVMMNKVAIMTDSIACIPQKLAEEYGIKVVPFHVIIDGKDYLETEVDMEKLYARLRGKENLPTTSAPSVGEFLQCYQELSQRTEAILHISIRSDFTMAYGASIQAKEMAREKFPKTTIEVIDSRTSTMGTLLVALEAARAARQDNSLDEVIEITSNMIQRVSLLSMPASLFYFDKGGFLREVQPWVKAEPVNSFKVILETDASISETLFKPVVRVKTKSQIMKKVVDIAKERARDKKLHCAILHANAPEQAEQLREMMLSQLQCDELYVCEALAATAIKAGVGVVEFGFYSGD
jgi:DegV family protein with EDD domain